MEIILFIMNFLFTIFKTRKRCDIGVKIKESKNINYCVCVSIGNYGNKSAKDVERSFEPSKSLEEILPSVVKSNYNSKLGHLFPGEEIESFLIDDPPKKKMMKMINEDGHSKSDFYLDVIVVYKQWNIRKRKKVRIYLHDYNNLPLTPPLDRIARDLKTIAEVITNNV